MNEDFTMFHTNGNRRPNPVLSIVINHHGKSFNEVVRFVNGYFSEVKNSRVSMLLDKKVFAQALYPLKTVNRIEWKSVEDTYKSEGNYTLFNITKTATKHEALLNIYIIPQEMLLEMPKQKDTNFEATMNPDFVVEEKRLSQGPVITVFTTEDIDGVHYFKSQTEALYYVKGNQSALSTVDVICVGDEYFEVKAKLPAFKAVNVNEHKLFAFVPHKAPKDQTMFSASVDRADRNVFTHDVDSFEDGLYKVQGSLTGAVLVETLTSKIKSSTRKAYFLKYGSDEYKKVVAEMPMVTTV
jgi:hypothetical protein